jgi:AcrR family transcriptional regulator
MPKPWNDREKEMVRNALQNEGRRLFEKFGLQKTTIDDIVRAAKISKGAFYQFYQSKEELYFSILELTEKDLQQKIYGNFSRQDLSKREIFRQFLFDFTDIVTTSPIYKELNSSNFEYLLRKLPEETIKKHMNTDFERLAAYFGTWMEQGVMRKVKLEALTGLFLSLLYFIIHRDDIAGIEYESTKDLWISMLTDFLILEK